MLLITAQTKFDADQKMAHQAPHSVSKNSMRDNKVREAAATVTAAAEEPSKRAENLSMQVNLLHRLYLPVVYPSL